APAAAATIAPIVEMFTVWARSPPVPTRSTAGPEMSIGAACLSMPAARPDTSATVSPLARSATANPAIWTSVAEPLMISLIAHAVSSDVSVSPSRSAFNSAGQVVRASTGPPSGARVFGSACLLNRQACALPHQVGHGLRQLDRVDGRRHDGVRTGPRG